MRHKMNCRLADNPKGLFGVYLYGRLKEWVVRIVAPELIA